MTKYKYFAILIGSVIAGLGGLYYVMDKSGGTTFVEASIDSFGWLAVALVIFTVCVPISPFWDLSSSEDLKSLLPHLIFL